MLMVVSPAKKLDESPWQPIEPKEGLELFPSCPQFLQQAAELVEQLKLLGPHDIAQLMRLSEQLAELNYERYQAWQLPFPDEKAKPAVYMFKGDVYQGLDIEHLPIESITYLQNHLRILSGLYGLLRPLDQILPYRLEMGTKFANSKGKDLYTFWGELLTDALNQELSQQPGKVLVNLASNEYFKAIKPKKLQGRVITPVFKDWKNGQYKIISFYAKKARGEMARYAALNRIEQVEDLKYFDLDGYHFDPAGSSENQWLFTRKQA